MSRYATVNKRLNIFTNSRGYEIWKDKKTNKIKYAHKELFRKFYGEIPEGYEIHHKDGNKLNNSLDNLIAVSKEIHRLYHKLMVLF